MTENKRLKCLNDTTEEHTPFSAEFYEKIKRDALRHNIEYSIGSGENPYHIIESLCNIIDSYKEQLSAYVDGSHTAVAIPYESLPNELKDKISILANK